MWTKGTDGSTVVRLVDFGCLVRSEWTDVSPKRPDLRSGRIDRIPAPEGAQKPPVRVSKQPVGVLALVPILYRDLGRYLRRFGVIGPSLAVTISSVSLLTVPEKVRVDC